MSLQNEASASVELPNICPGKQRLQVGGLLRVSLVSEKFVTPNAIDKYASNKHYYKYRLKPLQILQCKMKENLYFYAKW